MEHEALDILKWLSEAGDDLALADTPIDRFEESSRQKAEAQTDRQQQSIPSKKTLQRPSLQDRAQAVRSSLPSNKPVQIAKGNVTLPDSEAVATASQLAKSAGSLDELKKALEGFEGCNLRLTAKNLVFGDGTLPCDVMIIGEAPGRDEDIQGIPFVGRSGQLLERMLAAIGLQRSSVYITNVLPWRPPGNRTPTPAETEICRPFIEKHIELVSPKLIMAVGGASAKMLFQSTKGILSQRGRWQKYQCGDNEIPAIATLHPAYLLRQPAQKKLAWHDLLMVHRKLEEVGSQSV